MPSRVKSLANDALKPSPAPTINAVLYFMVSMNILHCGAICCAPRASGAAGKVKISATREIRIHAPAPAPCRPRRRLLPPSWFRDTPLKKASATPRIEPDRLVEPGMARSIGPCCRTRCAIVEGAGKVGIELIAVVARMEVVELASRLYASRRSERRGEALRRPAPVHGISGCIPFDPVPFGRTVPTARVDLSLVCACAGQDAYDEASAMAPSS